MMSIQLSRVARGQSLIADQIRSICLISKLPDNKNVRHWTYTRMQSSYLSSIANIKRDPNSQRDAIIRLPNNIARRHASTAAPEHTEDPELEAENIRTPRSMSSLENAFAKFENRCQLSERVNESDFVRTFDFFTRVTQQLKSIGKLDSNAMFELSTMASILLRCCGKLMYDTAPKSREMLAGNLWEFIKEMKLPIDISHYNSLLRVLNDNNTNFDPQKLLDEITSRGLKPDRVTYQRLIHQYCLQGDIGKATALLEKMKELSMQLNESTFSSLILGYGQQENAPSLDEMFELMRSNGVEPSGSAMSAAISVISRNFDKNTEASAKELKKLSEMIDKEETIFSAQDLADSIDALGPIVEKDPNAAEIFNKLAFYPLRSFSSRYRVLSALMRNNQQEKASEIFWSVKPSQRSIKSGTTGTYFIRLLSKCDTEFAINECSKLKDAGYSPKAFYLLFKFAAEAGNLKTVRAALDKIGEGASGEQVTTYDAQPLVRLHLQNNDFRSALESFTELATKHRITPCKQELMMLCLEKKDSESLQKIMNISTELYGESNSLFDLATCCLSNGKLKQAQKIFSSPGFRVNPDRVYRVSRIYAESGKLDVLEGLIHMTRDMYDVNQDYLYQILVDAYDRTASGSRALDLWNRMQEEEFQPSKKSLLMIAKVLEKNNIEVPFRKPNLPGSIRADAEPVYERRSRN